MEAKITWAQLRGMRDGAGVGFVTTSGDKFAGTVVYTTPRGVRLVRQTNGEVLTLNKDIVKEMVLLDFAFEMEEFEGGDA